MYLLKPHLSEKTFNLARDFNVYVFKLSPKLSKGQIKQLVEEEYAVKVMELRTASQQGKRARTIRLKQRSSKRTYGRRSDFKKAYITLKEGDSIPVFTDYNEKKT